MNFEWYEPKRRENLRKHGLDFKDAWRIFDGPFLAHEDTREEYGESRWQGTGLLNDRVVVVVFTERKQDTIRLISLRKANRNETSEFEKALRD